MKVPTETLVVRDESTTETLVVRDESTYRNVSSER